MGREQRFWATEKKVYLARLEEGRRAPQELHAELQVGGGWAGPGECWGQLGGPGSLVHRLSYARRCH
jgi:hypothetical protein